ncbi:MAG: hypothetical protein H0X34_09350 [Chthoniobacterales bacterium]|nr:hypothetical protein [Chthoniobacterales bacterium]
MKKTILRSIVSLSALIALNFASAALAAPGEVPLRGVWDSQVTLTDCNGNTLVSFEAFEMFHAGGTLTSTDNTPPTGHGPGVGTWTRLNRRSYSAPFQFFNFNADGSFAGTQKIMRRITIGPDGNTYTSVVNFEIYDPNGNLVFSGCGTEAATRLP